MLDLIPFFIILVAGLLFSRLFNRLHLPWVVALIVSGIVVGPYGLNIFTPSPAIEFMSEIGLIFLMFMAGLETKFSNIKKTSKSIIFLLLLNTAIPMAVGWYIGMFFNLGNTISILIGIMFTSSSIAVIIPSLEKNNLLKTGIGDAIITTVMFADMLSLVLFSIFLQNMSPSATVPLPLFYLLIITALVLIKILVPKLENKFSFLNKEDAFDSELRQIFTILIGVVVIFELLGLHAVIAGFFAGMVLSDTINSDLLKSKLHAIGYGIFIPIFFVITGTNANMGLLFGANNIMLLTVMLILGLVLSKFITGFIGGILSKFNKKESIFIGTATIPQLSTTLAILISGTQLGLFGDQITASIITLILVTSLFGPILISKLTKNI